MYNTTSELMIYISAFRFFAALLVTLGEIFGVFFRSGVTVSSPTILCSFVLAFLLDLFVAKFGEASETNTLDLAGVMDFFAPLDKKYTKKM